MRLAILVIALLSTTCAAHRVPVAQPTPHVWIPSGVPDDVVICVALEARRQWSCPTVGELRQILSTLAKL
jgi:hypothetical protein